MLLKPIKCRKCGSPIRGKERDMMLQCPSCGDIQYFDSTTKDMAEIPYTIAQSTGKYTGTLCYVPFWQIHARLNVMKEDISGGGIRRSIKNQKPMRGDRIFYVCASDMEEERTRTWNMDLTLSQPTVALRTGFPPAVKRMPMTMERDTALAAAEFLFLRYETEIPGILQQLDYTFDVVDTSIIYLAVWKTENDLVIDL